jgi:hypothetical protein
MRGCPRYRESVTVKVATFEGRAVLTTRTLSLTSALASVPSHPGPARTGTQEWMPMSAGVAVGETARVMRPAIPLLRLLPSLVIFIRACDPCWPV